MPPCEPWITADDVADCCDLTVGSNNQDALDNAADNATAILYELSGARYTGTCTRTVRPVARAIGWCFPPDRNGPRLSRVKLAGHVTAITEVTIDGDTIDPAEYRLDEHRYLTRLADTNGTFQRWPNGQRLDLPLGEEGTFGVTYQHGVQPPEAALAAASALACELYRACPAAGDTAAGECRLPAGVTRIVRQGITIDTIRGVASMLRNGATGIVQVDAFLAVHGRKGRAGALWTPDIQRFARPEGVTSGS